MTYYDHPGFNPGGIKDREDPRDYQYAEIAHGAAPFDWNTGYDIETVIATKLPVEDQDGSGSCGGQAWRYQGEVLAVAFGQPFERKSAKFIYAQTYYPQGGGSTGRDNANIFIKQGISSEALVPSYDNGQPPSEAFMTRPQDISDDARLSARHTMALAYANVAVDVDLIAQAIRDNHGAIIGITGQNNGTWGSPFPKPPVGTDGRWGHWLYAGKAKLINGVKHIGVLNSWGTAVGEQGWQWISEDYIKAVLPQGSDYRGGPAVFSVWTHVYNAHPVIEGFAHLFTQEMGHGALTTGPEVVALQKALQADGCFPAGVATFPNFGPITLASVKKFQAKYGIPTTGYVGPKTLAQLNTLFA